MLPRVRFAPSPTGYLHAGGARTRARTAQIVKKWLANAVELPKAERAALSGIVNIATITPRPRRGSH